MGRGFRISDGESDIDIQKSLVYGKLTTLLPNFIGKEDSHSENEKVSVNANNDNEDNDNVNVNTNGANLDNNNVKVNANM